MIDIGCLLHDACVHLRQVAVSSGRDGRRHAHPAIVAPMTILRRCAALAAIYAVALQLLLPAFASAAPLAFAAEAGFAICRGGNPGAPAQPPEHDPCGACLAHCDAAAAVPARAAMPLNWIPGRASALSFPRAAALSIAMQTREHAPRAPPAG